MKKLIYMGIGLVLCLSAAIWTGCDKPNELDPDNGGGSGGGTTEDVRDTTEAVYGFIKGVVTEKGTGTLISMATVELLPTALKTQTDVEGAFSFEDLDAGSYRLRVSKEGYFAYAGNIGVKAGQTANRTVSLEKEFAEIQILDTNGNALSELYLKWAFEGVFQLRNSGNVALEWNISELSEDWLACSKQSCELAPGTSERINVTIDKSKLPSDENEAVLNVVSAAGTIQLKVRVSLVLPMAVEKLSASMVYVEGGTFQMGATSEQGSYAEKEKNENPVHSVTLDGFYIGKYEVTQSQWYAVMGTHPSFRNDDNLPVEYVSWYDAVQFCEKLSEMTGKTYRLPTEAEWEYAARGGQKVDGTMYAGGYYISEAGWFCTTSGGRPGNSKGATHPVGQKNPNGLGLYDMSGNVWEWCSDWYGWNYYSSSPSDNPQGPSSGSDRVYRGGGCRSFDSDCRVSIRHYNTPDSRFHDVGFRVVCER